MLELIALNLATVATDSFYVVGSIVLAILGLFVIRFGAKFDVNKWLERRDREMNTRLMNTCPHMSVTYNKETDELQINNFFSSPFGTTNWTCIQCGLSLPMESMIPKLPNTLEGLDTVLNMQKKYERLARKAGLI